MKAATLLYKPCLRHPDDDHMWAKTLLKTLGGVEHLATYSIVGVFVLLMADKQITDLFQQQDRRFEGTLKEAVRIGDLFKGIDIERKE